MASINKISVNGTEYDILADELASIVSVSDTQPTEESNKIWIKDDAEEIAVPTMDEFNAVKSDLTDLQAEVESIEPGLSETAKTALLNCFAGVEWIGENGQQLYEALESALNVTHYPRITATFNSDGHAFYTYDQLDSLKFFLTVKYYETAESTGVVVGINDYTLSGTLTVGISRITVSYSGLTTAFNVNINAVTRESNLPAEYEQVTYIRGTGTQYLTTSINSRLPMRAEMRIQRGVGQPVVGAGTSSIGNSRFFLAAFMQDGIDRTNTRICTRISDDIPTPPSSTDQGATSGGWFYNRLVAIHENMAYDVVSSVGTASNSKVETSISVDGKTATIERKEPTVGYPMLMMKVPITSDITRLYLYRIKFYTGDTLLFDGIPCYKKSNGEAGLYDLVNNVFIGNSGTGQFEVGSIVA